MTRAVALRYALAPASVLLAVLVQVSPAGSLFPPAGLYVFAVLGVAWFGGAGPGLLTAALGTLTLPQVVAVNYPLIGGFLDLPRLIAFSLIGVAVGWGSSRRARALREQERYARAMSSSDDGFWDWMPARDKLYTSPRLLEIYGFPPSTTFKGRDDLLRRIPFYPEDRVQMEGAVADHFAGKTARLDIQMRFTREAETRWVHLSAVAARESGAVVRWIGTVRDITERKRVDEALRLSEERHARAMDGSDAGHWDWNMPSDELFISERAREMLALPSGPLPATRSELLSLVPQDSRHRVGMDEGIEDAIRSGKYERDYCIILQTGSVRWLRSRGKVYQDASGAAVRMTGSITDITERKKALDEVRESEARFRALTELSADWYWRQDQNLRFNYISHHAADAESYPREWMIGKTRWELPGITPLSFTWDAHKAALKARRPFHDLEFSRRGRDGRMEYVITSGAPIFDEQGEFRGYQGVVRNITGRKRAEAALRSSAQRYALAMEAAGDGHTDWDFESGEFYISPRLLEIVGHPPTASFADRDDWVRRFPFHPEDRPKWEEAVAFHFASGESHFKMKLRIVVRGEVRWTSFHFLSTRDAAGKPIRWTGSVADITEQQRIEEALRLSDERYAVAMEVAEEGHFDWNVQTDAIFSSTQALRLVGVPPDSKYGTRSDVIACVRHHPDDSARISSEQVSALVGSLVEHEFEYRILRDEEPRWVCERWKIFRDDAGVASRVVGVLSDITQRKLAANELRESEARKSAMFETALDCIVTIDHNGRVVEFNLAAERTFGYSRAEALGKELAELIIPPRLRAQHRQGLARYLEGGDGRVLGRRTEMPAVRANGSEFPIELSVTRIATEGSAVFTAYLRDITDRKRIEEALRQSEERFALAVEGSNEGIFDWDLVTDRVYMSGRAQQLFGLVPGEPWRLRSEWRSLVTVHPDDAQRLRDVITEHIAGQAPYDAEFRIVLPGGSIRWFRQRGIALRDASGKAYRIVGSHGDVSEKHKSAEELSSLERKLRQSQRLEAMGTLAGGIAHDFNNILGAILGYGEMGLRAAPPGSRLRRDIKSIVVAGERGQALVDRVLAFSRSGVAERVAVHTEKVVREALDLVASTLPSNITLRTELHAGSAAVLGDATQVHQVLMNLATNAVQAMTMSGTLRVSLNVAYVEAPQTPTIGTIAPGDYLVLEIVDSGAGIPPDILDHIFDPFFTTKEVGTGTGLGLSLVHGIVTELGGAINVTSTLGAGSTFTVYLPRFGDAVEPRDEKESALPRGDGQRVLIIDDEEPLVQLAIRTLADLGYVPTGFTSSAAALTAFRAAPDLFDALITDERMPGMSGTALIREVRGIRHGMPIVLMSGYVGNAVTQGARDAGAEEVLRKPLSARDLAASLERVLHS